MLLRGWFTWKIMSVRRMLNSVVREFEVILDKEGLRGGRIDELEGE